MKKLLALVLVLAISASANAGIVDFKISGTGPSAGAITPINPTSAVTLQPSQYAWIDLVYDAQGSGVNLYSLDTYFMVTGNGTISFDQVTYPSGAFDATWPDTGAFFDAGGPYIAQTAGLNYAGVADGGVAAYHILFHCDAVGDVTVVPLNSSAHGGAIDFNYADLGVGAGVTIHQVIPEPFTMALMGLGGLVALRRRR